MKNLIGYKIKKIREIRNISQDYVAYRLGITQASYSKIKNGKTRIDEEKLGQIAETLEVEPEIIKNFNEQVIFSCVQSGYINTNHINPVEDIKALYEKLLAEKDARIQMLEKRAKLPSGPSI